MAITIAAKARKKRKEDWPKGLPLLYEDEEEPEMGETNLHTLDDDILLYGLKAFFREAAPEFQVFSNMNLYYRRGKRHKKTGSRPYISPDTMVIHPPSPLPEALRSYTVDANNPAPRLTMEVLSKGTAKKRDMKLKPKILSFLGVEEYILVDPTGDIMPERLLLRRLQPNGKWKDERDADGGVTSQLGFRIVVDEDGKFRVLNASSGKHYVRPDEGQAEAEARQREAEARQREAEARQREAEARQREAEARRKAELRVEELEAELERLREQKK